MCKKTKMEILLIISSLLVLSLVGCGIITTAADEAKIMLIAKNIEKAIEDKDVYLFMQNISYNYSDPNGGTYDSIISLAKNLISEIEEDEELIGSVPGLKLIADVSITDLVLADFYASGIMEINIYLKTCFLICIITWHTESIVFDVDFQKEGTTWKIVSMVEIE